MRHCRTCTCPPVKRKAIAKVSRKVSTRAVDGIRTFADRERCVTKAAWQRRRCDVWLRDGQKCIGCFHSLELHEAEIHHTHKRSLGRDDRASNLVTLCGNCHRQYDSKPQWGKK